MIRRSLLLFALVALLPCIAWGAEPTARPVAVVFVESPGEMLSDARRAALVEDVAAALDWWATLSPQPFAWELVETRAITVDNPFTGSGWLRPHLTYRGETLEIYLVANDTHHHHLLGSHYAGYAAPAYGAAVALTWSVGGPAPVVAHELGHVLYSLPDRYDARGACAELDVMCSPGEAYARRWIGCGSLAALGAPCTQVWLPRVSAP